MPSGRVAFVSRNGAIVVVQHDAGFTVVELIGDEGELSVGDSVRGAWDQNGGETLFKDGLRLDGYFQGTWGSGPHAVQIARNIGGG
jgi:hypothetical protein